MWWNELSLFSRECMLYIGLVDTFFTITQIIPLGIETSFIGFTRRQCGEIHANHTSTSGLIFFERIGTADGTDLHLGKSMCYAYLANWYVGIVAVYVLFGQRMSSDSLY